MSTKKQYASAFRRSALIHEIMAKVELETETLRTEDHLGADLAYLFAALADPTGQGFVLWDVASGGLHEMTHRRFVEWFAADHPVWCHIRFEPSFALPAGFARHHEVLARRISDAIYRRYGPSVYEPEQVAALVVGIVAPLLREPSPRRRRR